MKEQTWDLLEEALSEIVYARDAPPGRRFQLIREDEENYAVLYIFTYMPDSFSANLNQMRHTRHEFVVPVATYHKAAWTRWVFDRFMGIETHEACESFQVNGIRIYGPHHGNGEDPYAFWPGGTREQKRKHPGED
jgi:hypothetical protein